VQSVAAIAIQPSIASPGSGAEGLNEAAVRSWETMNLGDEFEGEVGSQQVLARFSSHSPNTVVAALPFATLGWRGDNTAIRYRLVTALPNRQNAEDSQAQAWLPALSSRNGDLALEHGLHQEVGWERHGEAFGFAIQVFGDKINNPVIETSGQFTAGDASSVAVLSDSASGLARMAGPDFSTVGLLATVDRRLPGGNHICFSYASGDALVLPVSSQMGTLDQVVASAHPRYAQMYALSLSGTLEGSKTRWRASYRWQPEDTVTRVAPFALEATEPYLNLHFRQPVRLHHNGTAGIDVLLDVRNLLAQGYRPYLLGDGSMLIFAQEQRGVYGGLAFTF
jgi:hypothetical protein